MIKKTEKRLPKFNDKVDIAGFEKIGDDKYVFTKKNFFGFEDFSKRYLLNAEQRNKVWKSYCWCWAFICFTLLSLVSGKGNGGMGCYYITSWLCNDHCIILFYPLLLAVLYRIFAIYNRNKIASKYPAYKGDTSIHHSNRWTIYTISCVLLLTIIPAYFGISCIYNKF